jgi:hypothetical protein
VGCVLGLTVGWEDGTKLGCAVGSCVGCELGLELGKQDGLLLGCCVGWQDG